VAAFVVGALLIGGGSLVQSQDTGHPRPKAAAALPSGHRIEASDLEMEADCKMDGFASCGDLEGRVTTKSITKGSEVGMSDTLTVAASRTVVSITLGTNAVLVEPFTSGNEVRVMLSPLPGTTERPETVEAVFISQEKDPERVLLAVLPGTLTTYRNLAGRTRLEVVAAQ
jgi:hypothetical protein